MASYRGGERAKEHCVTHVQEPWDRQLAQRCMVKLLFCVLLLALRVGPKVLFNYSGQCQQEKFIMASMLLQYKVILHVTILK